MDAIMQLRTYKLLFIYTFNVMNIDSEPNIETKLTNYPFNTKFTNTINFLWAHDPTNWKLQVSQCNCYVASSNLSTKHKCLLTPWEPTAGRENPGQSDKQSSKHAIQPSGLYNWAPCHHLILWISESAVSGFITHTLLTLTLFLQQPPQKYLACISLYYAWSSLLLSQLPAEVLTAI